MATQSTNSVYIQVIEDVVEKVREEFINNSGPGEGVLSELQGLWELKMMQCGVLCGSLERSSLPRLSGGPIIPVRDLNEPYEGTEEYETPTAEILFPPTPLQTPVQTPLPGTMDHSMYNNSTGPNDFPTVHDTGNVTELRSGRPSPYMQPPSPWMNQRPLGVDVNVAYVEGRDEADRGTSHQPMTQDFFLMSSGKRKREDLVPHFLNGGYIPQKDGAGDVMPEFAKAEASHMNNLLNRRGIVTTANSEMLLAQEMRASSRIPQQDGPIPDPYEDVTTRSNVYTYQGVVNEDYNIVNTPAAHDLQAGTPTVGTINDDDGDDDDEPPLNEDDDDDLDDVGQGEEPNTQHLVLAQFDKVTRTKNRWKCTLKDGIMHINNKDVLFTKATGEFDF